MAPTSSSLAALSALLSLAVASNVWTVNCAPLVQTRLDPTRQAGVWPSTHVYAVVGSTIFGQNISGDNGAFNGKATTCDKYTDHSSYWAPQLYHMRLDGKFDLLPFTGMVGYYTNYTCAYNADQPGLCPEVRDAKPFPPGLRMIGGDFLRRTLSMSEMWQAAILLESGNNGEVYGMPPLLDGTHLSGHVRFPSYWHGVNVDSSDHQSHVAYPDAALGGNTQGGMCPESHPVALINIGTEFGRSLDDILDPLSLVFANGVMTGFGFHADFYQGWQNSIALQESFSNCFTSGDCPWRASGSPDGEDPNPTAMVPEDSPPCEDTGQNGPLSALPGDNVPYKPLLGRFDRRE